MAENATEVEIKKAFRRLARETHPDTHPGDAVAEERFKEVNEAYETLGDAEKRKQYDQERKNPGRCRPGSGSVPKNPFAYGMDMDDMFADMLKTEKPKRQAEPNKQANNKNSLNMDDVFSKFMGFKPKGR